MNLLLLGAIGARALPDSNRLPRVWSIPGLALQQAARSRQHAAGSTQQAARSSHVLTHFHPFSPFLTRPTAAAGMAGPFALFFVPKGSGGGSGGQAARDAAGNEVKLSAWLKEHKSGDRTLVQGLKGDATYLVTNDSGIENYGINAVCTHLGCVVPWNAAENKFMCPCHGSQYNFQGKVVRGPAPLSLALAHADIVDDVVTFSPWYVCTGRTCVDAVVRRRVRESLSLSFVRLSLSLSLSCRTEQDFRTGLDPWWK
jgi:cytochrome b6-f complex iron-sulfur subunit